jgi:predicted ester cyclase
MAEMIVKVMSEQEEFEMSAEENKAISRDFLDGLWNRRDSSVADRYIAANHKPNGPFTDQFPAGPEGVRQFSAAFLTAFPDVRCRVDRQEAEGDTVRSYVTFMGTQTGQLMNIPATNRKATVPVVITDRLVNGKIVETWNEWDPEDMLRQLGVG